MALELHEELVDIDAVLSGSERGEEAVTLGRQRLRGDLVCVIVCFEEVIGEIVQRRKSFRHS